MQRRCAWCGKAMGTKDGDGVSGETSGICPACKAKLLAGLPELDPDSVEDITAELASAAAGGKQR